jgi:two-component system response regulator AlgR
MPLRVLIADDEPPARWRLRALLEAARDDAGQPLAQVVAEAADAQEALARIGAGGIELALLDIQMPGLSGLALAAELQALPDAPLLAFVTAHSEHALAAFEVQALDYLTKPVLRERLHATLMRARERLHERRAALEAGSAANAGADDGAALSVVDRGRRLRVPLAEVVYLKAELKYVTLRTASHSHVLDESLAELEPRLGSTRFVRVHRNAIVARAALRELALRGEAEPGDGDTEFGDALVAAAERGWSVRVAAPGQPGEWLAVSRRQLAAVKAALAGPDAA